MRKKYIFLNIYTDASYSFSTKNGGSAYLITDEKEKILHYCAKSHQNETIGKLELIAVLDALKYIKLCYNKSIKEYPQLYIYSDSKYVVNTINNWIDIWKKNNWKKYSKKDVEIANKNVIQEIYEIKSLFIMIAFHIKSHTDKSDYKSVYNAMVDNLAKEKSKCLSH